MQMLSARLVLLATILGAIGLAVLLRDGTPYHLGLLGIYVAFVVCPMVWLSSRK
jgi:hypothetical protein